MCVLYFTERAGSFMLIPYTENDFSFRAETVDELSEFLEAYGGRKIEGLRSELMQLGSRSKKDGRFYESPKTGFWIGFDPQRSDYIIYRKDVYDPANLFFALFDIIVTPTDSSVEEEIALKTDAVTRYFAKAAEMEGESFDSERKKVVEVLNQMTEVIRSFDNEDFNEEEMERISETIDKTYFSLLEDIFNGIIERTAEPRINVKVDPPGM